MKKILGLDLGTNSIGWALIEIDHEKAILKIKALGSRILPMNAGEINDFESKGTIKSSTSQRTDNRGVRRNIERFLLRRDRLHVVLNLLNALPEHYKIEIDFERNGKRCGQFKDFKEPKIQYLQNKVDNKKYDFLFEDTYKEMLKELKIEYKKRNLIPRDWTLYYLRQKALTKEISLEEFAWVLLSYNQKRGYEKIEVENKATKENEIIDELDLRVKNVTEQVDETSNRYFKVELDGNDKLTYNEYSNSQMTFKDDLKEVKITSKIDDNSGSITSKEITIVDIYSLTIQKVDYEKDGDNHNYTLTYQNGWYEMKSPKKYTTRYTNIVNKPFEYIVETVYDEKGNIKKQLGKERKLREPDFSDNSNDWTLLKKKTEKDALAFNLKKGYINKETGEPYKYISLRIYDVLKKDAQSENREWTKIVGGMFQVVERDFYRAEVAQIISTQKQHHTTLDDTKIFEDCVKVLYPNNENHANALLSNKDALQHLLIEDILLYQRPLKTKKSEIANCKYEVRQWKDMLDKTGNPIEIVDTETGEVSVKKAPIYYKVVSASHPYFQEFRIWDKLHNLRLIQIEKTVDGKDKTNIDVTEEYFSKEIYQELFTFLNNKSLLKQDGFISFLKDKFAWNKKDKDNFIWNFPEDEEIKGNETRVNFAIRFKRRGFTDYANFLTQEKEIALWHYLYSVSYKERIADDFKSIKSFFSKFFEGANIKEDVKEGIIKDFANYPKFASKYCAYSEKALKKLLPFIRMGENKFKGHFDISVFKSDLESINYDKTKILSHIRFNSENRESLSKEDKQNLELRRQNLFDAIWKNSINERIHEILKRQKRIDFSADEIDYSKVISNDKLNGNIPFPKGLINTFKSFEKQEDFINLNLTQASYLVYGRHSELAEAKYWISPKQIRDELHQELKQHSLNNPIAEKVILEMMQIVACIWEYYGTKNSDDTYQKLFDEIHLEVGRELKKSAKEKQSLTGKQSENKVQNKRLRQTLEEFLSQSPYNAIPQNSDHFERLKIVEDGASHTKNLVKDFFNDKPYTKKEIDEILKKPYISKDDFEKYKLWIEQGYKSPYTDKIIKISDLFDRKKYNIDHVFPQASVTNDSLSNKVVCELEINKLKSSQTGREFINNTKMRSVPCLAHKSQSNPEGLVEIINDDTYVSIVKSQFSGNKRQILLSKEIPSNFTNSQLNNSRHIARKAMELLSHIVREPGEIEFRSKNVLPVTGEITSKLKRTWKLDEVWSELVSPRFIRMNELTKSELFGQMQISKYGENYFDCNIDDTIREKDPSYGIKRIDHRHHALDALIVALCTEEHVNYINNINSNTTSENYGKQKQIEKYRETLKRKIMFSKPNKENPNDKDWFYMYPGQIRQADVDRFSIETVLKKSYFYKDTQFNEDYKAMILSALQHTIVTFKQNMRVINKTINLYNNTSNKNSFVKQKDNQDGNQYNWAIRRSLGKSTYYGKVYLGEKDNKQLHKILREIYNSEEKIIDNKLRDRIIAIKKGSNGFGEFEKQVKKEFKNITIELKVYKIASREFLSEKFNRKRIKEITDTGIQKILLNHIQQFDTVKLPFEEAITYYDYLLEKPEIVAIIQSEDSKFNKVDDFVIHLKSNSYKYKKTDYSFLNVFIDLIKDRDFRTEFKEHINEHPEIAFTVDQIDKMNQPENLKKLNEEKNHTAIKKVRSSTGYGNQRQVSDEPQSVKSKQYIVNDAGSNLYLGVYERSYIDKNGDSIIERKFQDIGLIDLIEKLKQDSSKRNNPLPEKIFDDKGNEYYWKFTISPLDLVYVPIEEEIANPSLVNFNNLDNNQINRIYKYVDGNVEIANFIPYSVAQPIWRFHDDKKKREVYNQINENHSIKISEKELIKDEFGFGSQQTKNQNMIDGKTQIKKTCWKLKVDRLGNISLDQ
jgi:CRISPR-associated endonuclease Csn1